MRCKQKNQLKQSFNKQHVTVIQVSKTINQRTGFIYKRPWNPEKSWKVLEVCKFKGKFSDTKKDLTIAVITDVSGLTCKQGERVNLVLSAVWHANEAKGSIWHCIGPLASFVGSITSRCSGKWARTKTGLERAAEIEPNSFAYFLKTK